jgi:plasmid stabilization system protein ParE
MKRLKLAPAALNDIEAIFRFIENDSPAAAIRFRNSVMDTIDWLAEMPVNAPLFEIESATLKLRKWAVRHFPAYLILHTTTTDVLDVRRVVDGRRDLFRIIRAEAEVPDATADR